MGGFLAAHQMAVARLAIEYCNTLVADMGTESSARYLSGFNFGDDVATAFGPASSLTACNPVPSIQSGIISPPAPLICA